MAVVAPPDHSWNDEPRRTVVRRRLSTVPRTFALLVVLTLLAPVAFLVALTVDIARSVFSRRPWMAVRLLAFAWVFLAAEAWGLVWFFTGWVRAGFGSDRERLVESAWPVQAWWARTLFGAVQRLFGLDLEVAGLETATPGPVIAMFRHASIVDNLLPAVLLTDRTGLRLRWIIKRELLSVPGLDVGGNRLPNYFVNRESGDPRTELRRIRALAHGLGPDEGVLIYPEGTRFTRSRRAAALDRLRASRPELWERASRLRHVMPPRLGGVLTLLEAGHDVLICGHDGLGGFARISDLWSGAIVGRTVRVWFRRIASADIPRSRADRIGWLYDQWQAIDDWIAAGTVPA